MTSEIENIKTRFGEGIFQVAVRNERRVTLTVDKEKIVDIAGYLYHEFHWRFIIASALESNKGIEIFYHFSNDSSGLILNLKVILDKEKTEIESLTCLFEASSWIEREMHEILGINFLHHPNLEKLISDGNWAEGVYPYRKEPS
ncbi:MAG: ndhJ [Bacteroidetes bacterium]|jgi:NADH-quinone oxidoreductase subunit C|nr:ndhJ [Bacteroidota bacterium]MBS1234042.1 ndhJ [Bacteroidota bacterium]